jgi:hypothetical protein
MCFYVIQTQQGREWASRDIVQMEPCHLSKYLSFLAGEIKIGGLKRKKDKGLPTRLKRYNGEVREGWVEFDGERFIRHDDCGEAAA